MKTLRTLGILLAGMLIVSSCREDSTKFIFFTDTHFPDSEMDQPALFEPFCRNEGVSRVVWGGDAISRYASPDSAWAQQIVIEEQISQFASVYNVRGNHDFSRRLRPGETVGHTLNQEETAERMKMIRPEDVISNGEDPGACYYYFDDAKARVRFLVLDTNDKIEDENAPMGAAYQIGEVQREWICTQAIGTAPEGWSLIIFSHVPMWWMSQSSKYPASFNRIREAAADRGLPILAWIAGHIHRDTQLAQDGQWEITSYCYTPTFPRVMMFDTEASTREGANKPCFDVVTLAKGHRILSFRRVGAGHSRVFHLETKEIQVGASCKLRPTLKKIDRWEYLDAFGRYLSQETWTYSCQSASFDAQTRKVTGLAPGEAMIVAISPEGVRESFLVRIVPAS